MVLKILLHRHLHKSYYMMGLAAENRSEDTLDTTAEIIYSGLVSVLVPRSIRKPEENKIIVTPVGQASLTEAIIKGMHIQPTSRSTSDRYKHSNPVSSSTPA